MSSTVMKIVLGRGMSTNFPSLSICSMKGHWWSGGGWWLLSTPSFGWCPDAYFTPLTLPPTMAGSIVFIYCQYICLSLEKISFYVIQVWLARRVSSTWSTTPPTMSWCAPRPWWSPALCRLTPPLSGSGTRLTMPLRSAARRASNWWVWGVNVIEMGRGVKKAGRLMFSLLQKSHVPWWETFIYPILSFAIHL